MRVLMLCVCFLFFFFKQKTAYEMRISDWSSDVCSSDLVSVRPLFDYSGLGGPDFSAIRPLPYRVGDGALLEVPLTSAYVGALRRRGGRLYPDRKSVV